MEKAAEGQRATGSEQCWTSFYNKLIRVHASPGTKIGVVCIKYGFKSHSSLAVISQPKNDDKRQILSWTHSRGWSQTGNWGCWLRIRQLCALWSAAGRRCWASDHSGSHYNPEHGGWCSWSPAPPETRRTIEETDIQYLFLILQFTPLMKKLCIMCMYCTYVHTPTHTHTSWTVRLSSQTDELCSSYFMTSPLICTDKTTREFTHQGCIRQIVSRCGRKKNGGQKMRGREVEREERAVIYFHTEDKRMTQSNNVIYCSCIYLLCSSMLPVSLVLLILIYSHLEIYKYDASNKRIINYQKLENGYLKNKNAHICLVSGYETVWST